MGIYKYTILYRYEILEAIPITDYLQLIPTNADEWSDIYDLTLVHYIHSLVHQPTCTSPTATPLKENAPVHSVPLLFAERTAANTTHTQQGLNVPHAKHIVEEWSHVSLLLVTEHYKGTPHSLSHTYTHTHTHLLGSVFSILSFST